MENRLTQLLSGIPEDSRDTLKRLAIAGTFGLLAVGGLSYLATMERAMPKRDLNNDTYCETPANNIVCYYDMDKNGLIDVIASGYNTIPQFYNPELKEEIDKRFISSDVSVPMTPELMETVSSMIEARKEAKYQLDLRRWEHHHKDKN